ncbi:TIM barrel protein [Methanofollis ethanolicus]|uniref:TIM barrel protein n=1 Tax=Methanofollis ethanolicus TaxID=488124 RepID=UPI000835521B|nr:TIM barrel protein [Methanofollis ethanolicus]
MKRLYRIGAGVRSDDLKTFSALAAMHREGQIDHVQVQVIPAERAAFRRDMERIADAGVPIVIHAPHHGHGVNPCAPTAYDDRPPAEIERWTEEALALTAEAADVTGARQIVLHAGRHLPGRREEAEETFAAFLDGHFDPRFILENLPAVYAGYPLLGNTAEELLTLAGGRVRGFCLDFAHLFCTANYLGIPYANLLAPFDDLPLGLFHLSNSRRGSVTDEHLPINHPEGGLDFATVIPFISAHPAVETSLEYKENDPRLYAEQVPVFDALFQTYRP